MSSLWPLSWLNPRTSRRQPAAQRSAHRLILESLEQRIMPSNCALIEGQPVTFVVSSISDNNPNVTVGDFQATTSWSDGVTTTDQIVNQGSRPGVYAQVYATRTFPEAGIGAAKGTTTLSGDGRTWTDRYYDIVYDAPVVVDEVSFSVPAGGIYTGPIATLFDTNPFATPSDFEVSEWSVGSITYFPEDTGPISGIHFERSGAGFTLYATINFHGFSDYGRGTISVGAGVWDINPNTPNPDGGALIFDTATITARPRFTTTVSSHILSTMAGSPTTGELLSVQTNDPAITMDTFAVTSGGPNVLIGAVQETHLAGGVDEFSVNGTVAAQPDDCGPVLVPVTIKTRRGTLDGQVGYNARDYLLRAVPSSAVEGQALAAGIQVAIITGPATAQSTDYTAQVDWGDGETSTATIAALGTGQFSVRATKPDPYAEEGTYTITVTATGPGDDPTPSATTTATVANASLRATAVSFFALASTPFTGQVIATLADTGPAEPASGYQVAIDWGDNNALDTSTGQVETSGGGLVVVASHMYRKAGNFQFTATIRDNEAGKYPDDSPFTSIATVTGIASVSEVLLTSGVHLSLTENQDSGPVVVARAIPAPGFSAPTGASINWGDRSQPDQGTIVADGQGGYNIVGDHTYSMRGPYPILVTITDPDGPVPPVNSSADVAEAPLEGQGNTIDGYVGIPQNNVILAVFDDTGEPDGGLAKASHYRAAVYWTPTQTQPDSVYVTVSDNELVVKGTPHYSTPGEHDATILVAEKAPGNANDRFTFRDLLKRLTRDLAVSIDESHVFETPLTDNANRTFATTNLQVPVVVQNLGNIDVNGSATIRLYLSPSSQLNPATQILLTSAVESIALPVGQTTTFTFDVKKPGDIGGVVESRKYYIIAKLVPNNFTETDNVNGEDRNNVAVTAKQYDFIGSVVDLWAMHGQWVPLTVNLTNHSILTFSVKARGVTGPVTVQVYQSNSDGKNLTSVPLGVATTVNVVAGTTQTFQVAVTSPPDRQFPRSPNWVLISVDDNNQIRETNESNNIAAVAVEKPDALADTLDSAPIANTLLDRAELWIRTYTQQIFTAAKKNMTEYTGSPNGVAEAIAGAIVWEAVLNGGVKLIYRGPGKVHWEDLDNGSESAAKQVEDLGYLPAVDQSTRESTVFTPEGAIDYIGAIVNAYADQISKAEAAAGKPNASNIFMRPDILATFYNGVSRPKSDLALAPPSLIYEDVKDHTESYIRPRNILYYATYKLAHQNPYEYSPGRTQDMGAWVHAKKNVQWLAAALGLPAP
jgi:hypothetical protein